MLFQTVLPFRQILQLILVLAVTLSCHPVWAQTRIHRKLTPADGLVQSQVISLHEDNRGYLWIGTFGGLSRWDGQEFRNFGTSEGMGHKEVQAIAEAPDGRLYFATKGGGVSIWDQRSFTVINESDGLPNNVSRAITMLPNGDVAVGTDSGVAVIRDGVVLKSESDSGLQDILVVRLEVASDGSLYVATWGDGLLKAAGNPLRVVDRVSNLPVEKIRALAIGPDDEVFFALAGEGVFSLKDGAVRPLDLDSRVGEPEVVTLHVAANGKLLVGTQKHGVFMQGEQKFDNLEQKHGLSGNTASALAEGRNGRLFIGTWAGVSIFDHDRVITLDKTLGLTELLVTSIGFSTSDEGVFLGFQNGGIQKYLRGQLISLTESIPEPLHEVWAVHENSNGSLFIGSDDGLHRLDESGIKELMREDGLGLRSVQKIFQAKDGSLVAMEMHGLYTIQDELLIPLFDDQNNEVSKANTALELEPGKFLLGTVSGLFEVFEGKVQQYQPLVELSNNTIWDLHPLNDGRILVGTNEKGLLVHHPKTKANNSDDYYLTKSSGLTDNTILAIAEDKDGDIYLSTNRGVNILHPEGDSWSVRSIGHPDGLGSDECVQGALAVAPNGKVWIGTIAGPSDYDKTREQKQSKAPFIHMDKISIFDREVPWIDFSQPQQFPHRDNYLKFEFTGINLAKPDAISYRYRLSSVDQDWVQSDRQYVQYTNLAPGHYQFELGAVLADGPDSPVQSWAFTIRPPFWRTWWFMVLSAILVGGAVSFLIWWRVRHLLALERLRTRIAADLHDDIGSGLTEINIMTALIPLKLPAESSALIDSDVQRIGDTARQLTSSMSDIVWLVNPQLDSLFDLMAKLGAGSAEVLADTKIRFEDRNLDSLQKVRLPMEHRRQLLLIFKEAINNAVKYSQADHICLEADHHRKQLSITLTDNGVGFAPSQLQKSGMGNGLKNMRARALKLSGECEIVSSPNQGTKVIFKGPVGR